MRIAIVGYGRMGRLIESISRSRGHTVVSRVDPNGITGDSTDPDGSPRTYAEASPDALAGVDVAIEFSHSEAVIDNVRAYLAAGAVVATTGWHNRLGEVEEIWKTSRRALVYGSNFSIGAHLFLRTAAYAASLVSGIEEYDLLIHEIHHGRKRDSPSGTALMLADAVMSAVPRKKTIETSRLDRAIEADELHVSSSRGGSFPGTHTLYLDSSADTIEIRHQARSREGFAMGAVMAAEWIVTRESGVYPVETFISDLVAERLQGD